MLLFCYVLLSVLMHSASPPLFYGSSSFPILFSPMINGFSDDQWLEASLPVLDGGLGIRRVSSLATPAFLASAGNALNSTIYFI